MSLAYREIRIGLSWIAVAAGLAYGNVAPGISSYQLGENDFLILSAPEQIFQVLGKQVNEPFPDTTQLLSAIQADMLDHPDIFRTISSIVRLDLKLPSLPSDTTSCVAEVGFPCPVKQIWLDSMSLASLQEKLVAKRRLHTLPPALLNLIRDVVGVDYPEEELLHQALINKLIAGIGTCSENLSRAQTYTLSLRLPDSSFLAMMEQLIPLSPSLDSREIGGNSTVALLNTYRNRTAPCSMSEVEHIHQMLQGIYDSTLREEVHGLCHKIHPASPKAPRWTGDTCGCVSQNINGLVYGIYPSWRADTTTQTIDFSVVNRIEFLGLSFDDAGILTELDPTANAAQFIREARSHGNQVDWVVSRSDWDDWTSEPPPKRKAMFDTLAGRIASFLNRPLPDAWSRLKSHLPFPTHERFTWGDGVTLHFADFPTDQTSVDLFNGFFRKLDTLLTDVDPAMQINLMFPRATLAQNLGVLSYTNLLSMLHLTGGDSAELHKERTHLLVLLDEPSRDSKKMLQQDIDFQLHGKDRKLFLHALIPVEVFDGKNEPQLAEDILYGNDTYYGIGIWPLPFANAVEAAKPGNAAHHISQMMLDNFNQEDASKPSFPWLSSLVCLYRWEFRFLLFASLLFSLAAIIVTALHCPLRHFLTRHVVRALAALVVPPLALFTLLLYFDPDLAALAHGNAPFVVLATLMVLGAAGTGLYLRSQKAKPSREALREELRRMGGGR